VHDVPIAFLIKGLFYFALKVMISDCMPYLHEIHLKLCKSSVSFSPSKLLSNRDGPDQNSPQIGQFSGNTALESVYSTSNQILIKFHSDFTTSGFFVLSYHGWYYLSVFISFGTI
jgi:hypothetical protein